MDEIFFLYFLSACPKPKIENTQRGDQNRAKPYENIDYYLGDKAHENGPPVIGQHGVPHDRVADFVPDQFGEGEEDGGQGQGRRAA